MITKRLLISTFLITGLLASPFKAQAGIWDILNPFGINKILAKTKFEFSIEQINKTLLTENQAGFGFSVIQNDSVLASTSPITPKTYKPKRYYVVAVTGYSSTPDQTDNTPFITASGTHVRDGVAASNFLPFGTIIKLPEIFGDKTFVVEDRMASRYWLNIDIWFPDKETAKSFGVKIIRIEIIS